ncbi:YecA family protein [Dethiothermospora halolimnae]|uniref:YecA family protein n=1 Tax=Dethiothermospora halolimnae TaxID=3114390 RepID=UPI003CCC1BC8
MILKKITEHYGVELTESNYKKEFINILAMSVLEKESKKYFAKFLRDNKKDIDMTWAIYMIDFLINIENKNQDRVLEDYEVLRSYPKNYYLESEIANCYMIINNMDKAKSHYMETIRLRLESDGVDANRFKELMENDKFNIMFEEVVREVKKDLKKNNKQNFLKEQDDTYEYYLNTLTKKQLTDIRKEYKFKGLSTLNKKELAKALAERIPNNLDKKIRLLGQHEMDLLKKIVDNEGVLKLNQFYKIARYLEEIGIGFSKSLDDGTILLILPTELLAPLDKLLASRDIAKDIRDNTEVFQLIDGCLHYYGVINTSNIISILKERYNIEMDTKRLVNLAFEYPRFSIYIERDEDLIYYILNDKYKEMYAIHKKRQDLDYYQLKYITIKETEKSGDILLNKKQKEVLNYFKRKYGLNKKEAKEIIFEFISMIQIQGLNEIMEFAGEIFVIENTEDANEILSYLVVLNNNTRMWKMKGYKPSDLSSNNDKNTSQRRSKKIGRNEPCPCGSGKKYKKCCGGNK